MRRGLTAVSGTTELARSKMDDVAGASPFAVFMVEDVSADIGSSSQSFSAITQIKVVDSSGTRIQSDSNNSILANELWLKNYDLLHKGVQALYTTNTILYPFGQDPRGALYGQISGFYNLKGSEAVTLTSSDANADNLKIIVWKFRVLHFKNNRLQSTSDLE